MKRTSVIEKKIRIIIIDDHLVVCEGLTQMLRQEPNLEVCGNAQDAITALKMIGTLRPDIAIVDISLAGKSGIELISNLKISYPEVQTIVLTMHTDPVYCDRALKAGAKGYVTKQEASETIIKAIHKVLGGGTYVNDTMSDQIIENFYRKNSNHVEGPSNIENLSQREFEVFNLIGQGLKTKAIAEALCVSVKTIHSHRENIKNKLNLKDAYELLNYAMQIHREL